MRRLLCSVSFSLALLALSGNAQAGFVDEESVAAAASTAEAAAAHAQRGPTLDDFLTVVKNTLNKVKLDKDQPPLKKVTVNLKTTAERTAGGTFKIFVISFGTTNTNSSEETLNIDLTGELGKEAGAEAAAAAPPPVSTRLAGTIQARLRLPQGGRIRQQFKAAKHQWAVFDAKVHRQERKHYRRHSRSHRLDDRAGLDRSQWRSGQRLRATNRL
jgi:hypothetical protein